MPLEKQMKSQQNYFGTCGDFCKGIVIVIGINILFGLLGYWKYGDKALGSITLNIPIEEYPAQLVKILIGLAFYGKFVLQFNVCFEIGWNSIKDKFTFHPSIVKFVMKSILVAGAYLLAVAVPTISPFIGSIGFVLFFIFTSIIIRATYYEDGFGLPGSE